MICVIGSGPAGVSAAFALVKSGQKVLMLDVGLTLEPEIQNTVSRMAGADKLSWQPDDLAQLRGRMRATSSGVPLKYAFGSDFPYREAEAGVGLMRRNADILPSFAMGGLSNVWGAALLPNCEDDMADWPVSIREFAPHYAALHEFMPLSASRDELEETFPLFATPGDLPVSQQAGQLLHDLRRHRIPGLSFGQSRLAVNKGCISCGMCLYGCPLGLIYNSSETLSYLLTLPNFSYQSATIVHKVEESQGQVSILAEKDGEPVNISADALFLAAGTLSSTRIVLESLAAFDHPLTLKNSQYFLFPLLRPHRTSGACNEELHTLSQLFLELSDPKLSSHTIHLQCYTYNDLFQKALWQAAGNLGKIFPFEFILERLLLIQGYLHSDESASMQLTLRRNGLELIGQADHPADATIRGIMKKLRRIGLSFSPQIGTPGRGFHSGGSLPMRKAPAPFETDIWGRPHGFERVHVVDASVLPSIPATTITYTVMANAHRIAAEYGRATTPLKRPQRCAVTGANGYVGGAIVSFLRRQGIEVIPLVRRPTGSQRAYSLENPVGPETLKGVDFLVHAAHDFSITDIDEMRRVNIDGGRRLFAAAREANVRDAVFISSLSAFEGCKSNYGRTKLAIEALAVEYKFSIIRPGLVFGPAAEGMIGTLKRLAKRKVIPLVGEGDQLLYLAHQEDLALLVWHLLNTNTPSRALCQPLPAAHSHPLAIKEIIGSLAASRPVFLPLPDKIIMAGLRFLEAIGYSSRLRSDSLLSLLTPSPPPDFLHLKATGIPFRPFLPEQADRQSFISKVL